MIVAADADGFGRWFTMVGAADREAWSKASVAEAMHTEALLLGRRTCEWFIAQGWPAKSDPWADRLRALPKSILSGALEDASGCDNTAILHGSVAASTPSTVRWRRD